MKLWLMMVAVTVSSWAASTNLVSFETRDGKHYKDVRIVSTNRDGLIIKVPGELGFKKEMFTNLPPSIASSAKQGLPAAKEKTEAETRAQFRATNAFLVKLQAKIDEAVGKEDYAQSEILYDALNMIFDRKIALIDARGAVERVIMFEGIAGYGTLPNVKMMEKNKEVEEAQIWDDYRNNRISRLEYKKRERDLEAKYLNAENARAAAGSAHQAAVARKYAGNIRDITWEEEEIEAQRILLTALLDRLREAQKEEAQRTNGEEMICRRIAEMINVFADGRGAVKCTSGL